jgi:hypothetical protein
MAMKVFQNGGHSGCSLSLRPVGRRLKHIEVGGGQVGLCGSALNGWSTTTEFGCGAPLTRRELEVSQLIATRLSNKAMAARLRDQRIRRFRAQRSDHRNRRAHVGADLGTQGRDLQALC